MAMVRQFQCPVNVSPVIRTGRWCMLLAGVVYGAHRHNGLQRFENEQRAARKQLREMRDEVIRRPVAARFVEENSMAAQNVDTFDETTDVPKDVIGGAREELHAMVVREPTETVVAVIPKETDIAQDGGGAKEKYAIDRRTPSS